MGRLKPIAVAAALAASACLAACDSKTAYDHYANTAVAGWEKGDTVVFDTIAISRDGVYTEQLGLRTTGDYPFQSLTLIVEQTVAPESRSYTDTLSARLTDEGGETMGSGISIYQHRFSLRSLTLQAGDTLTIRVRHDMKREILPGIKDVGVKVLRN